MDDKNKKIVPDYDQENMISPLRQNSDGSVMGSEKILGPRNPDREKQDPDMICPPETDHGKMINLKWSFADSHIRLDYGGWARETTKRELPVSTSVASVNMHLKEGGVRELHWHKEAEWAMVMSGTVRVTAVDEEGRNHIADTNPGDMWYFPSGIPHSLVGVTEAEFLLVFDDGGFSEDSTFSITDWIAHTPKEVLAKNFNLPESAFSNDKIPNGERYIYQGRGAKSFEEDNEKSPYGEVPNPFTYSIWDIEPVKTSGGWARIADSQRNFYASKTIAAALVEVEPGGVRELHWHPNADEWQFYLEGQGRMTVFAAEGHARTFDYVAGDVGYVPHVMGHYVENTGDTTLRFLEMFRDDHFAEIALNQWMGVVSQDMVSDHFHDNKELMSAIDKEKHQVIKNDKGNK